MDESVPYCTLKSFPASIEHCIQWARDKVSGFYIVTVCVIYAFIMKSVRTWTKLFLICPWQFESSFAVKPDLFNKFWKQHGEATEVITVSAGRSFSPCFHKLYFHALNFNFPDLTRNSMDFITLLYAFFLCRIHIALVLNMSLINSINEFTFSSSCALYIVSWFLEIKEWSVTRWCCPSQ